MQNSFPSLMCDASLSIPENFNNLGIQRKREKTKFLSISSVKSRLLFTITIFETDIFLTGRLFEQFVPYG